MLTPLQPPDSPPPIAAGVLVFTGMGLGVGLGTGVKVAVAVDVAVAVAVKVGAVVAVAVSVGLTNEVNGAPFTAGLQPAARLANRTTQTTIFNVYG